MLRFIGWFLAVVFLTLLVSGTANAVSVPAHTESISAPQAAPTLPPGVTKTRVTFKSGDLTLVGYLYKPDGNGPFPGIIWNHGSEQSPGTGPEFDAVATIFVPAGYVVFAPIRRGHGDSQGEYIQDQLAQEKTAHGADAAQKLFVQLMAGPQLDDQLAGLAYLNSLPYVDKDRLAVTGCSYGGIQTLLAAERGAGFRAAVAISPGAESWNGNKYLQDRLIKAVDGINMPVFLLHPEKDANVAPGYVLGQEFQRLGKPYGLEIYPPFGPSDEQGHCFGGAKGYHTWGPDVLWFLSNTLH
jgi:carboxymethylenebutenolidase